MSQNEGFRAALKKLMKDMPEPQKGNPNPVFIKSLEWDLGETWIRKKMDDFKYAENVYNAICNTQWQHVETNEIFHCSWRHAGDIVARNRRYGECYMDFYCSGNEGVIDPEIVTDFAKLGWLCVEEASDLKKEDTKDLVESSNLINEINKD